MSLTIDLTPEEQQRLEQAAEREGVQPETYAHSLLIRSLAVARPGLRPARLSPDEAIRTLDAMAERYRGIPAPPSEAYERESLYEDVPYAVPD